MVDRDERLGELFYQAGLHLAKQTMTAEPEDRESLIFRGQLWFEAKLGDIRSRICNPNFLQALAAEGVGPSVRLKKIADVVSSFFVGIPIILVAEIIVEVGVDVICGSASKK